MDKSANAGSRRSALCTKRIMRDVMLFERDSPKNIYIDQDDKDITLLNALIIGPSESPYEGGFFLITIKFPEDYPHNPPSVRNMTTDNGRVKFGPNLYESGKVCISILNTVGMYRWSPVQTLTSVLVSIQSLFSEYPYSNKRGFNAENDPEANQKYNESVAHEVIRVAVCGMLDNSLHLNVPESFQKIMKKKFLRNFNNYQRKVEDYIHLDGQSFYNVGVHYVREDGVFKYAELLTRLKALRDKFSTIASEEEDSTTESGEEDSLNHD